MANVHICFDQFVSLESPVESSYGAEPSLGSVYLLGPDQPGRVTK
jgi:hypothetical protein